MAKDASMQRLFAIFMMVLDFLQVRITPFDWVGSLERVPEAVESCTWAAAFDSIAVSPRAACIVA